MIEYEKLILCVTLVHNIWYVIIVTNCSHDWLDQLFDCWPTLTVTSTAFLFIFFTLIWFYVEYFVIQFFSLNFRFRCWMSTNSFLQFKVHHSFDRFNCKSIGRIDTLIVVFHIFNFLIATVFCSFALCFENVLHTFIFITWNKEN